MNADHIKEARELGAEHACAAATWITDGNDTAESRRRKLELIANGEFDANYPNLSGEWADDPTPYTLYREITGEDVIGEGFDLMDELAEAYEEGVSETFELACEAELLRWLA